MRRGLSQIRCINGIWDVRCGMWDVGLKDSGIGHSGYLILDARYWILAFKMLRVIKVGKLVPFISIYHLLFTVDHLRLTVFHSLLFTIHGLRIMKGAHD